MQDRRLGARGHALWGTGAGAVLRCCSVEVLVASLGCCLAAVLTRICGRQGARAGAVWGTLRGAVGESGDGAGACWRD